MGLIKSLKALTWDATATAAEILTDYTAYSKGEKLTGTASGGALDKSVLFKSDGTNYAFQSVVTGGKIIVPNTPTKSGYNLRGWCPDLSSPVYRSFPYVATLDEETLHADWALAAKATVTGLGSSSPGAATITKDATFPASFPGWTDANGNIFIKIPTMYRKITATDSGQITGFNISTFQEDEYYVPYSCFIAPDGVTVLPWVAIGKYCSTSNTVMNSISGSPVDQKIDVARTNAQTIGTGYQIYDWQLQKLFVDLALVNYGYVNFNSGRTISTYLGVENLYYDIWIDGVTITGTTWAIAQNPENYINNATTSSPGYQSVGYSAPSGGGFIQKLGYDASCEFFNFTAAKGATNSTYYCDYHSGNTSNSPICSNIGEPYADSGLWHTKGAYNRWSQLYYARLCYRPVSA